MVKIGDDFIIPDGETQRESGVGLHLYAGGLRKFGVPLRIELQRATESSGSPGTPDAATWRTIRVFGPGPRSFMDLKLLRRIGDHQTQRNYYYRARHIACGLTPGAWTDWSEGIPEEFFDGYQLPPVPSYPKIHIEQTEVPNDPTKVNVALRATPEHADTVIKYQVLNDTDSVPPKWRSSWTTYTGIFQVTRSDTTVKKIVAYGELNRIVGNFYMQEVTTDRVPQILSLTISIDTQGNAVAEITTDSDSGSVKVLAESVDFPTKSEVQSSGTCSTGRNVTTATLLTLNPGDTVFVAALPYTQASCAGVEGELSRASLTWIPEDLIDPSPGENWVRNGDIEAGFAYWGETVRAGSSYSLESTSPAAGTYSLKMTTDGVDAATVYQVISPENAEKAADLAQRVKVRVRPGSIVRFWGTAKVDTGKTLQLKAQRLDDDKASLGVDVVVSWTNTSFTEKSSFYTVPSGTHYLVIHMNLPTTGGSGSGWIDNIHVLRGKRASDIDDEIIEPSGHLNVAVGVDEDGDVRKIFRHTEDAVVQHTSGEAAVTFPSVYENAPLVVPIPHQVISFNSSLGTAADQYLRLQSINVSASGATLRAVNVKPGTITAQEDDFPAGNSITSEGQTVEVNLNPSAANDDSYNVHWDLTIEVNPDLEFDVTVEVIVAIDTNDGAGWVERLTKSRSCTAVGGVSNVCNFNNESASVVVTGLGLNDDIRLRIKQIIITSDGPISGNEDNVDLHGHNKATDGDSPAGATYNTATDTTESAMPNSEDGVRYSSIEVS